MNCITWNHDWYSFWNFDSFDDAGFVAVSLESKKLMRFSYTGTMKGVLNMQRHDDRPFDVPFWSTYSDIIGLLTNTTSLKIEM